MAVGTWMSHLTRFPPETLDVNQRNELRQSIGVFKNLGSLGGKFKEMEDDAMSALELLDAEDKRLALLASSALTFTPRQKVKITRDQPDWNFACAAYPKIGMTGRVTATDKYGNKLGKEIPENKTAVKFLSVDLGYEPDDDDDHKYCVYFIWSWALELA